jgi:hypothetical protein
MSAGTNALHCSLLLVGSGLRRGGMGSADLAGLLFTMVQTLLVAGGGGSLTFLSVPSRGVLV